MPDVQMLVLTRCFPYPPGEQFVASEARHWAAADRQVTVMPWAASGEPQPVPGVRVDLTLARTSGWDKAVATVVASLHAMFWRDLRWLLRRQRLNRATVMEALQATRNALLVRDKLLTWTRRNGPVHVVYSYWFDVWTLGALLAARRSAPGHGIGAVATRVHGYDLHEERHPAGYHGLKRQLAHLLDALLPVSASGGRLAVETFGVRPEVVRHAPLGAVVPPEPASPSPAGELHLLSVASALPVKRIDRLVDATRSLALARPDLRITWTHLGGGPLLDDLRARAENPPANLAITWAGQVTPEQVTEHFRRRPVDLFVNTSESEGVPVSIMEAMGFGVPALAPDVGAISEIVPTDGPGGALLPAQPSPDDVAAALAQWSQRCKEPAERSAARMIVADQYDADANARQVMQVLSELGRRVVEASGRNQ